VSDKQAETQALEEKPLLQISVGEFCKFTMMSGSLGVGNIEDNRAREGSRLHRQYQKQQSSEYEPEVTIQSLFELKSFQLLLQGRMDGLVRGEVPLLEEIKSTIKDPRKMIEQIPDTHRAQLMVYAYLFCLNENLSRAMLQWTYLPVYGFSPASKTVEFAFRELEEFFLSLLNEYESWTNYTLERKAKRDESIRQLEFPFKGYRPGQRALAVKIYQAIRDSRVFMAQAPTGTGKTMGTLFPAIKAIGEGLVEKTFFLSARTTGLIAAKEAVKKLQSDGCQTTGILLTARDKSCIDPQNLCQSFSCNRCDGYFDRLKAALIRCREYPFLDREQIQIIAGEFEICPFELSLDESMHRDIILCDYNYAFHPRVFLKRYFLDCREDYVFLVDEAHNLVDRGRSMYSSKLSKTSFAKLKEEIRSEVVELREVLVRIMDCFANAWKALPTGQTEGSLLSSPDEFQECLEDFYEIALEYLREYPNNSHRNELIQLALEGSFFARLCSEFEEDSACLVRREDGELSVELVCLDPSRRLELSYQRAKATIMFSATLNPVHYFRETLGCPDKTQHLLLNSPFPPQNFLPLIHSGISTYYQDRNSSLEELVENILSFYKAAGGNILCFFPSFEYLNSARRVIENQSPETELLVQERNMEEWEREEFLEKFEKKNNHLAFAVLGGIFSEGIDLVGDKLCGVAVVGVGLPSPGLYIEELKHYYDRTMDRGFEFSQMLPGFHRILQAAGRLIRTEEDRGCVLLLDKRFAQRRYRELFPDHWHIQTSSKSNTIQARLESFYAQGKEQN